MGVPNQDVNYEGASAPPHREECKADAVELVVDEDYGLATAVGVGDQALRL